MRLRASAALEPPTASLADIAVIECADKATEAALQSLEIGRVPYKGATAVFSQYAISRLCKERGLGAVTVLGQQCVVTCKTREASQEELKASISSYVASRLQGADYELSFASCPESFTVPSGSQIHFQVDTQKADLAGSVSFRVQAFCEDQVAAQTTVRCELRRFKNICVLTTPVARGQRIGQQDVVVKRCDVTEGRGLELVNPEQIVGSEAKRSLAADKALVAADLAPAVLIKRGEMVRIQVSQGAVNLELTGCEAIENGRQGEIIQFKNPINPSTMLRARVIAEGLARVGT